MAAEQGDLHDPMNESPFMRSEFVFKDDQTSNISTDFSQQKSRNRSGGGASECASSAGGARRGSSPVPRVITNREDDDSLYVKLADLPDDVREQVRRLVAGDEDGIDGADDDKSGAAGSCSRASAPAQRRRPAFGEPTRLSAQPTIEEIQMCFAQIDLAILMETNKPPLAVRRFQSPNNGGHDRSSVPAPPPPRPRTASPHRADKAEYAHRVCARRAFRSPPRLVIPKDPLLQTSDSDTSSGQTPVHHDPAYSNTASMNVRSASPAALHGAGAGDGPVKDAPHSPTSQMQRLLIERAKQRRKTAAAMRSSAGDRPTISERSGASSPILAAPVSPLAAAAVSPGASCSDMQQQLMERAMMRRSVASAASTEGVLSDGADQPRKAGAPPVVLRSSASTGIQRNGANARQDGGAGEADEPAQSTFASVREDFLLKLQQIQQLAAAGARGSNHGPHHAEKVDNGKMRAYQLPIWTHRSCSSSSLNGCRSQDEDIALINGLAVEADLLSSDSDPHRDFLC